MGDPGNEKLCTVSLSKIAVPGRKPQIADRKIADKLYCKSYENFQSPGLPHSPSRLRGISIGGRIRGFLWIGQFYGWDSIRIFKIVCDPIFANWYKLVFSSKYICSDLNTKFI
jgi:hypothetical protein